MIPATFFRIRSTMLLLFFVFGCCVFSSGQTFRFTERSKTERVRAGQLVSAGTPTYTLRVVHDNLAALSADVHWRTHTKYKSIQNYVKFMVAPDGDTLVTTPYVLRLTYTVKGFPDPQDTIGTYTQLSDTLTISYNPDSLGAYQDMHVKRYSGFHKMLITLTGLYKVDTGGVPVQIPFNSIDLRNFAVEGEIVTQPYHKTLYGYNNALYIKNFTAAGGSLPVAWHKDAGSLSSNAGMITPVNYELEWTYVDDYKKDPVTGSTGRYEKSELSYDFGHNSTRVWLDTNYYQIPLVYSRGYIVYRVRMVRPDSVDYHYPVYSKWSNNEDQGPLQGLSAGTDYFYHELTHSGDSLNWQYTVSFAENGKYKHVASYYDGLLKNRQSVTRFNSDPQRVIVTEPVYDYEGVAAINILPTPVDSTDFGYQRGVSLNYYTGLPYTAADFDTIRRNLCPGEPVPARLHANALANRYYSPLNPNKSGPQKFVPDAGGYPFVQTLYSPGIDKRVERQGGAGDSLQIGRGHDTRNEYVSAEQSELNQLFGVDAGYGSFYRKTVTTDPNGQKSMSVQDYKGRQMASSLVGVPDTSRLAIERNTNVPELSLFSEDLLLGLTQQRLDNKITAEKNFYMDAAATAKVKYAYELTPLQVCTDHHLSIGARYHYTVMDECGSYKLDRSGVLGTTGVLSDGQVSGLAAPADSAYAYLEGKNTLHKELTLDMGDIYATVDSFMSHPGTCLYDEPYFIRNSVEAQTFPCPEPEDECGKKKKKMIEELFPGHKYGMYNYAPGYVDGNGNSVLDLLAPRPGTDARYYRYQDTCMVDWSTVSVSRYGVTYTQLNELPVDTFLMLFSGSDAYSIGEVLLPLHPEYCKLQACFPDTFQTRVMAIPDGVTAGKLGLLTVQEIIAADPIRDRLYGIMSDPADSLARFRNQGLYLDSLAMWQAYCHCSDSVMLAHCMETIFHAQIAGVQLDNDEVRNSYFKFVMPLYFANRERMKQMLLASGGGSSCGPCADIRLTLTPAPVFPNFFNPDGTVDLGPGGFATSFRDSSYIRTLLHAQDTISEDSLAVLLDSAQTRYQAGVDQMAYAGIDSIVARLGNCYGGRGLSDLRTRLLQLYSDGEAPMGYFTPQQVHDAMAASGLSFGDLCNPYLVNYDRFMPSGRFNGGPCLGDFYYQAARDFMNRREVLQGLQTADFVTVNSGNLDPYNEFEQGLIDSLGLGSPYTYHLTGGYLPDQDLYLLSVFAPYGTDTIRFYLHGQGTGSCSQVFAAEAGARSTEWSVTDMQCISRSSGFSADGYIGNYGFTCTVQKTVDQGGGDIHVYSCTLQGWNNRVRMTAPPAAQSKLKDCIPCTQIKALYSRFDDTLRAYDIKGVDHPYYHTMLRGFMTYELGRSYDLDQYLDVIAGCGIADSIAMNLYTGYGYATFTSAANAAAFWSTLGGDFADITEVLRYKSGSTVYSVMNLNAVPKNLLGTVKANLPWAVNAYSGTFHANTPWMADPLEGRLLLDAAYDGSLPPASPVHNGFGAFTYTSEGNVDLWMGGEYISYAAYAITAQPGATLPEITQATHDLQQYMGDQGIPGWFIGRKDLAGEDSYNFIKTPKKHYLDFVYQFQSLRPGQVLERIGEDQLAASVYEATYGTAAAPGKIQNLYMADAAQNGRTHYLGDILDAAKSYFGNDRIFFDGARHHSLPAPGGTGALDAYRCSDGSFWYRYFGAGDTMYNVFVKLPAYIPADQQAGFRVLDYRILPGDSTTRSFIMHVTDDNLTVAVNGFTDFVIGRNLMLRGILLTHPVTGEVPLADTIRSCERTTLAEAVTEGKTRYRLYMDSTRQSLYARFYAHVMDHINEQLTYEYIDQRFNYTLYYYDRAGNRTMTVPPEGVHKMPAGSMGTVNTARSAGTYGTGTQPAHTKQSQYNYNSGNQLVWQHTPDGGTVNYYLDALGRPVFSQNDKQKATGRYTYTLYDPLGRVTETGQIRMSCFNPITPFIYDPDHVPPGGVQIEMCTYVTPVPDTSRAIYYVSPHPYFIEFARRYDPAVRDSFVHSFDREDVVFTVYDTAAADLSRIPGYSVQENLRKRVACVKYFTYLAGSDSTYRGYDHAAHYSYDVSGNVKTLVQDYPALAGVLARYKRIDYDYDLVSGKINMLSYNRGHADQYYQRYRYDADNRVVAMESSPDGYIWKQEAGYQYYQHGPLARMVLGDKRAQGVDYAYTIQGWLKAINGDILSPDKDMGGDGAPGSNRVEPRDAVSTGLDYFQGDYRPIGSVPATYLAGTGKNLYNGNIARQTTGLLPFVTLTGSYGYDQLNRIKGASYGAVTDPVNATLTSTGEYKSSYAYDQDGNITRLVRYGNNIGGIAALMDSLNYHYPSAANNKLAQVTDHAADVYDNDIRRDTSGAAVRYMYDPTGNTIRDMVSGQDTIQWNLYNKVVATRNSAGGNTLRFAYDGAGNRISKTYAVTVGSNVTEQTDYYVRDVQGHILAVYRQDAYYVQRKLYPDFYLLSNLLVSEADLGTYVRFALDNYGETGPFRDYLYGRMGENHYVDSSVLPVSTMLTMDPVLNHDMLHADMAYLGPLSTYSLGVAGSEALLGKSLYSYSFPTEKGAANQLEWLGSWYNVLLHEPDSALRRHQLELVCTATNFGVPFDSGSVCGLLVPAMDSVIADFQSQLPVVSLTAPALMHHILKQVEEVAKTDPGNIAVYFNALASDSTLYGPSSPWYSVLHDVVPLALETEPKKLGMSATVSGFWDSWPLAWGRVYSMRSQGELERTVYDLDPESYLYNWTADAGHGMVDSAILADGDFDPDVFASRVTAGYPTVTQANEYMQQILYNALTKKQLYLSEHDLYGSSRVGTKQYWPEQLYNKWTYNDSTLDGSIRAVDTSRLMVTRPWYSLEYQELIGDTAAAPYGKALTAGTEMQHTIGQKQLELTNHLGNVLATVSDKVHESDTDGNHVIDRWSPALAAVYDYYPFGMLMPGRYVQDTARHCVTTTQTVWVQTPGEERYFVNVRNLLQGLPSGGTILSGTLLLKQLVEAGADTAGMSYGAQLTTGKVQDGAYLPLTVDTGKLYNLELPVVQLQNTSYRFSVTEERGGQTVELGSLSATAPGLYNLAFRAQTGVDVRVRVVQNALPAGSITVRGWSTMYMVWVQRNVLTSVCSGGSDKYRFGFNGQEKVNEWSGIGNFMSYEGRGLDTRTGKWLSVDPLALKYPNLSPYHFGGNNPIMFIDPDGKRIVLSYVEFVEGQTKPKITAVVYHNGKLTTMDGKEYVGTNEYILKTAATLNQLRTNDIRFDEAIGFMENDNYKGKAIDHTITNRILRFEFKTRANDEVNKNYPGGAEGSQVQSTHGKDFTKGMEGGEYDENMALSMGLSIKFVPDVDRKTNCNAADFSDAEILIHEIKHDWNKRHGGSIKGKNADGIKYEEIDAMHFQNIQRRKEGKTPRTSYNFDGDAMSEDEKVNLNNYQLQTNTQEQGPGEPTKK